MPNKPATDKTTSGHKPVIGLTGGIGSGKSTVASVFADAGCAVINSDDLNSQQLATPEVIAELTRWWGKKILTESGTLNRKAIASVVFQDPSQRKRLESFLHPRIACESERRMDEFQAAPSVRAVILDSPLLLEAGLDAKCDTVVFVDADDQTRLSRVVKSRGWTEDQWRQREKSQFALDKKRMRADHVLANNSSDLDELRSSVDDILQSLEMGPSSTD